MIKRLQVLLVVIAMAPCLARSGPIIVGKGAGESEFSLLFVRANLPTLINTCETFACPLTAPEHDLLAELERRAATPPVAVFKPDADLAGELFVLSGAEVWFNLDMLWLDTAHTQAYSIPEATALWIEVLARGQGFDENLLTDLAAQTRQVLQQKFTTISTRVDSANILGATIWHSQENDRLYLFDPSGQTLDISAQITTAVGCHAEQLSALQIFSGTWQVLSIATDQYVFALRLNVTWACANTFNQGEIFVSGPATQRQSLISIQGGGLRCELEP